MPTLFDPIRIGNIELKNRIIMCSPTRSSPATGEQCTFAAIPVIGLDLLVRVNPRLVFFLFNYNPIRFSSPKGFRVIHLFRPCGWHNKHARCGSARHIGVVVSTFP
jgi:hypothetical protein